MKKPSGFDHALIDDEHVKSTIFHIIEHLQPFEPAHQIDMLEVIVNILNIEQQIKIKRVKSDVATSVASGIGRRPLLNKDEMARLEKMAIEALTLIKREHPHLLDDMEEE